MAMKFNQNRLYIGYLVVLDHPDDTTDQLSPFTEALNLLCKIFAKMILAKSPVLQFLGPSHFLSLEL